MPSDRFSSPRLAADARDMRSLGTRRLVLAVAVAVVASAAVPIAMTGSASAARLLPLGSPVKIVTPARGLVTSRRVRVIVRTAANLRKFNARLGSRSITSAFHDTGGGRWVGELTPRDGLTPGPEELVVLTVERTGRKGTAAVALLVGRATSTFVRVGAAAWRRFVPGTLLTFRLRAQPSVFSVRLNGLDATAEFAGLGLVRQGILGADTGLRYGANTLVITAAGAGGDFTRITRRLIVSRIWPLIGPGMNERTFSGEVVHLSAARTVAARRGDRLSFHWVLASIPRGSTAHVAHANSMSPTVKPDLPGRYILRLRVSEQARAATGSGSPLLNLRPVDAQVTLTDTPSIPPIGLAINTMSRLSQFQDAIQLGTGPSDPNYHYYDIGGGDSVGVLVLDRATLAVQSFNTYTLRYAAAALSNIESLPSPWTHIVVVSAQQFGSTGAGWSAVLKELGASYTRQLNYGNWSVIGVPGAPDGGIANTAGLGNPYGINATEAGAMTGYLREEVGVTYPRYAFVVGQYDTYSTSSASSATQNTMTIDGQSYSSQTINCPSGGGLQLLALSALTLAPVASGTYATNCGNPANDQQQLTSLANQLAAIPSPATGPHLLFLQSIGTPYAAADATQWYALGLALVQFGGTASVFDTATGAYALAGSDGMGEPGSIMSYGAETSSSLTSASMNPAGTLTGELRRDASYHFQVIEGEPDSTGAQALTQLIYPAQPLTPWDVIPASVQQQIIPYITDHFLSPQPDAPNATSCYAPSYDDVRAEYCDLRDEGYLQTWWSELEQQKTPPSGSGISPADWTEVRDELKNEFLAVPAVYKYIQALKSVFYTNPNTSPLVNVEAVYAAIKAQLPVPPTAPESGSFTELASALFQFGALAPGADTVFGILGAASTLAGDVTQTSQGTPEIDAPFLDLTADQLAAQLAQNYSDMSNQLDTLYEIIITDPGKLRAFQTSTDFNYSTTQEANTAADLVASAQQVAYANLLGSAYRLDLVHEWQTINPSNIQTNRCGTSSPCVNNFLCEEENYQWFPFSGAASDAQFVVPIPPTNTQYGQDTAEVFVIADPTFNGAWYPDSPISTWIQPVNKVATPTQTLLKPLFDPLGKPETQNTQQALGLYKQWFWAHEFGQALVVPASTAQQTPVQQWAQQGSSPYYFSCEE
jgi:hypothetical protein